MNPHIRLIEPKDNKQIEEVIIAVSKEYGTFEPGYGSHDPELKDLYSAYKDKGSKYWIIEDLDIHKVLGGGGYTKLRGSKEEEKICEMQKLFFLPETRRKGLGKKLVEMILEEATKDGYKEMYLESVKSMKEAKKLYEKYGFEELDKPIGCTGHGHKCTVFMKRKLDKKVKV